MLCLFDLNLLMKPMKNFFVYKCKLSLALLYLADMFVFNLNTKFNSFFTEWLQIKKPRIHNSFWRNFPTIAKQMPSKVLFVSKKTRQPPLATSNSVNCHWNIVDCFADNRRTKDTRNIKLCSLKACCVTLFSNSISHYFFCIKTLEGY